MARLWWRPAREPADNNGNGLRQVVAEVASQSVAQVAPAERAMFSAHVEEFLDRPGARPGADTDSPMGFGGDLGGLLSPEVVAAAWVAVRVASAFLGGLAAEAAKDAAKDGLTFLVRKAFHHPAVTGAETPDHPAPAGASSADVGTPAHGELVRVVRTALEEHFRDRNHLAPDVAGVISESIVAQILAPTPSDQSGEHRP